MPGLLRDLGIAAGAVALAPLYASAQAPSAFVEPAHPDSVRALGLGGAFVALADDSSATIGNPAGLCRVPRSLEALLGPSVRDGDWRGFGSAALRPSRRLALGAQLAKPPAGTAHPVDGEPPTDAKTTDTALGAAFLIGSQSELSLGASVQLRRLSADGLSGEDDDAWSWSIGALFRPVNPWSPRLGLRYRHRTDWELEAPEGAHRVREASVLSAGASWYYEPERWFRLALSLQPDLVFYSQLQPDVEAPEAHDDVDLRAAAEATIPLGCWTGCGSMVQLRVGLLNSAALPFAGAPSGGADGARRRTSWSFGAAFAHAKLLQGRVKLEAAYDRRSETVAFGLGYRFPEAFRAEVVDSTRRAR